MNFSRSSVSKVLDFGTLRAYDDPALLARMSTLPRLVTRSVRGEFFDSEGVAKLTINAAIYKAGDPTILDIQLTEGLKHLVNIAGPTLADIAAPSLFWGFTVESNPHQAAIRGLASFFDKDFSGSPSESVAFIEATIADLTSAISVAPKSAAKRLLFKQAITGHQKGLRGLCLLTFVKKESEHALLKLV